MEHNEKLSTPIDEGLVEGPLLVDELAYNYDLMGRRRRMDECLVLEDDTERSNQNTQQNALPEEALRPDEGNEKGFEVPSQRFAFTPGQSDEMFKPVTISALWLQFRPVALRDELRTNKSTLLSVDETNPGADFFLYPHCDRYEPCPPRVTTRFLDPGNISVDFEKRLSPFHRRGRKLALPMQIRGRTVLALPDTGSDIDAIDSDLAGHLGLKYRPSGRSVRLGNGSKLPVLGKVSLHCSFVQGKQLKLRRKFYIFSKLSSQVQMILGRGILDQTQTLTKYQDRLREHEAQPGTLPRLTNMSVSKRRLKCYIDRQLALATADTGSEVDLMKESYAKERGLAIESVSEEERFVQLPGNTVATISGKVNVRFDTFTAGPQAPIEPTSQGPVLAAAASESQPSNAEASAVLKTTKSNHYRTFYLMPSLTSNVLLGEELLDSIDAFHAHLDSFVDFESLKDGKQDLNSIKWLNALERKLIGKSTTSSTWPPSHVRTSVAISPPPNLDAIESFLGKPLNRLDLSTTDDFLAALSIRSAQDSSRHRRMRQELESLTNARQEAATDPIKQRHWEIAISALEQRECQAQENYVRDKQRCTNTWDAWRAWLSDCQPALHER